MMTKRSGTMAYFCMMGQKWGSLHDGGGALPPLYIVLSLGPRKFQYTGAARGAGEHSLDDDESIVPAPVQQQSTTGRSSEASPSPCFPTSMLVH